MSDVLTIDLSSPTSRASVAPARGGMLTALEIDGRSILFMDETTLDDPKQNVRGGAPVLFPSPGKLAQDMWSRAGRIGSMKQHGFARNAEWQAKDIRPGETPSLELTLASSDDTRRLYPWDFHATLVYTLGPKSIRIDQRVENKSSTPMPFGFGFHPYFSVLDSEKAGARVPTRATRAFDNKKKVVADIPPGGIDLTADEVDMHLLDHDSTSAELHVANRASIVVMGSPEYARWVIWTLRGRDFVCVEPWTCPGNALNTGEGLIELAPGEARSMWISIGV
jgi:galactose mutarotase-like enzyme